MKIKQLLSLMLVCSCLCLSGCVTGSAEEKTDASGSYTTMVTEETLPETESKNTADTKAKDADSDIVGEVSRGFFDANGNPIVLESCDVHQIELRTAYGWTVGKEDVRKLENNIHINGLEMTEVYSRYSIENSSKDPDYHKAVMNQAGYCLGSAEDPFGSFRLKGVVTYEGDGFGEFYVFRAEDDEYFPFISARRAWDRDRSDTIIVNGEETAVQPLPIWIRSEKAAECFEEGSSYIVELSLETIRVTAYAQQSSMDDADKNYADCYLIEVCSYEEATVKIPPLPDYEAMIGA